MHAKAKEFTSLIEHEIECDKANTFLVIPKVPYNKVEKKSKDYTTNYHYHVQCKFLHTS